MPAQLRYATSVTDTFMAWPGRTRMTGVFALSLAGMKKKASTVTSADMMICINSICLPDGVRDQVIAKTAAMAIRLCIYTDMKIRMAQHGTGAQSCTSKAGKKQGSWPHLIAYETEPCESCTKAIALVDKPKQRDRNHDDH